MQSIVVPVHYDFASTICYVAHRVMERVALAEIGVELVWEPLDLGLMMGWKPGSPVEGPGRDNALRVARELDVPVHMPGSWLDSKPALAVALSLRGTPQEVSWRERVWTAAYEEARDTGDPDEIERLCRDLGVDASAARDEAILGRLAARTRAAADDAVTGLPSFMLAGLPIGGIQEPGTMQRMLGRYAERQREEPAG
ncbi:MAG: DsbA family protein [Deltaproteobacteria bacterium]|nr:DsbA family protein [Deltaproteobacteria bacterium]MBW2413281.1 DsbA family protein [Deltaproteobacteria bacterium]